MRIAFAPWSCMTHLHYDIKRSKGQRKRKPGVFISHFLATDIYLPFLILLFVIGDRFLLLLLLLLSRCPRFSAQSLFSLASFHLRSSDPSKWWVFPPFSTKDLIFFPLPFFFFLSWFLVLDLLLIYLRSSIMAYWVEIWQISNGLWSSRNLSLLCSEIYW